jgi:RNA polymerase sigma-70 factor (ECF subfamily)
MLVEIGENRQLHRRIAEPRTPDQRLPDRRQTDQRLMDRLGTGDREALAELYRAHHPAVYRCALYLTADPAAASEVTQDVFVWLMDHSDRYDSQRGQLAAFLGGVTRKFAGKRRQADRQFGLLHEPFDERLAAPARTMEPDGVPELRRAIAALPPGYRAAVGLCDLEGRSYEEAAALLDVPVGTVRSRLHRARALLARKLGLVKKDGAHRGPLGPVMCVIEAGKEDTLCVTQTAPKSGKR